MAVLKILVVDDEPGIRSGVSRILQNFHVGYPFMEEDYEFEIHEASTGEEGVEIINEIKPDILLLDNKLPGMQGVEVLEYIKKRELEIVVVMITSYASLELAIKATRDGAYDFIPKPFTPQELRSSIENISKQVYLKGVTSRMREEGKQVRFQFLSVMSHELKAPLNAIEGYLKMIRDKQIGESLDDYKEIIERSLLRIGGMRQIILDMLDLTKIESRKTKKDHSLVCMKDIASNAIDTMRPYAIQRDVDVYLNINGNPCLKANPDDLEIILNNLISNAIKYNKDGGRVDCILREESNQIVITVTDTGIGISDDDQKNLFNEFVRIKNEKTRHITGSGLGLSIVKNIVDIYHGDVQINSIPDKGTTFTVKLPKSE